MIISMGIDPSATRTGVAISHMKGDKLVVTHQASLTSEYKGLQRGAEMADDIGALVDRWKPNIVTLEGYAFGNKFSLATLVEVGTMIRWVLMVKMGCYHDVSPTSLKKFITGVGKGEKDKIMMHVLSRWGVMSDNNDVADAIGLSAVGLAYSNEMKVPKTGKEVLGVVKRYTMKAA